MIDFIRSLLESALKTNPYLEKCVITGCLRISKESIFTGLNNLKNVYVKKLPMEIATNRKKIFGIFCSLRAI